MLMWGSLHCTLEIIGNFAWEFHLDQCVHHCFCVTHHFCMIFCAIDQSIINVLRMYDYDRLLRSHKTLPTSLCQYLKWRRLWITSFPQKEMELDSCFKTEFRIRNNKTSKNDDALTSIKSIVPKVLFGQIKRQYLQYCLP